MTRTLQDHERRRSSNGDAEGDGIAGLASALLRTRGLHRTLRAAVPEVLRAWAGTNGVRRLFARPVEASIARGFAGAAALGGFDDLKQLLSKGDIVGDAAVGLPTALTDLFELASALGHGASSVPAARKARALGNVLEKASFGKLGQAVTSFARAANETREACEPDIWIGARRAAKDWVRNVDFGELKEFAEGTAQNAVRATAILQEELWQFPAKMLCVLSVVPALGNACVGVINETLAPINKLAPDLLADVIVALLSELKGAELGRLVHQASELFRKLHTGSELTGDPGKPRLPEALAQVVSDALGAIDPEVLRKARSMLEETKETTAQAVFQELSAHPELVREMVASRFRGGAAAVRRWERNVTLLERGGNEDVDEEIGKGIGELDVQALADTVNRVLTVLNRVRRSSPSTARNAAAELIDSLDEQQLADTVSWVVDDLVTALRPVAPVLMPPILKGVAQLLTADDPLHAAALSEAKAALRQALAATEANP